MKLPKLKITKFKENHLDWTIFWSQFEEELDQLSQSPVAKLIFLSKRIIGTKSEINDRRSAIYI